MPQHFGFTSHEEYLRENAPKNTSLNNYHKAGVPSSRFSVLSEIRRKFLDFFIQKGHREVHSSSLVPANDPTLLFTNAGMNQFKDVFLGLEKRDYARATTSQKCVRAGGKHNDLENVGFTNRHHTFFEMLGNFSFGDYFKKDAVAYAWELITSPEWFGIAKEKVYVTIFKGENGVPRDSEAYDLWLGQGVPKERIYEFGAKDNFWQMGDTGPCGPCSEIHYDMGVFASDQGHKDCVFGCDCGRYVEIWNLVFMQFDRDSSGKLTPLPKPSIDTGMGLERLATVLQGVISNYDTDLFNPLIEQAAKLLGMNRADLLAEVGREVHEKSAASLRVIADHSRAATFLISDGVTPSNEGRGYVLRKIIRRGITHGRLLGQTKPFLHHMVFAVRDLMQDAYPELKESADRVSKAVLAEETRFAHTMALGLQRLEQDLGELIHRYELAKKVAAASNPTEEFQISAEDVETHKEWAAEGLVYSGWHAFRLYDTFGLPLDFIEDACRDQGVRFDRMGFERAMAEQRERARASWKGGTVQSAKAVYQQIPPTVRSLVVLNWAEAQQLQLTQNLVLNLHKSGVITAQEKEELQKLIVGKAEAGRRWTSVIRDIGGAIKNDVVRNLLVHALETGIPTEAPESTVVAMIVNGGYVESLSRGETAEVFLDRTPFYAESGGQVGDRGWFLDPTTNELRAEVEDCYFPVQGVRAHKAVAKSTIRVGDILLPMVDEDRRVATMRNHTATHLLHAGLREVLGKHVKQAGSLVAPNHLRFDFSHFTGVEDEQLQDIEDIINKEVLRNESVEIIENVPIDVAVSEYHAMALFGEKYGDKVRVIKIGDFSTELCGGTHTLATGEIGLIKILKEGSVSSGVRRIEAVTGEGSLRHFRKDHELEGVVASLTSKEAESPAEALRAELEKRDSEIKRLTRELDQVRMKSASSSAANLGDKIKEV
ncbi:MAG: alanine--tRNA ligase, partial [Acidobacteriia bacterium]|nr:alanine--tRNA ligase [Terriglobia bacterium]